MSEPNEPYLGILISSDGTVCRIGLDGFPIDSGPEPPELDEQQGYGCEPLLAVYDEIPSYRACDAAGDRSEHDRPDEMGGRSDHQTPYRTATRIPPENNES